MTIFIPILYAVLLGFWLYRDKRFRLRSLPCYTFTVLFLLKCLLGVAYMLFHQKFYDGGDTMKFIRDGKIIYETLFSDPLAYLRLTFGPNAVELPASFQPQLDAMGFWSDTSAYMMVRFNAVANLLTFGNEFGNIVIMAFLSTLGMVALIRAFRKDAELPAMLLVPFLVPTILFWTSGIHKEALLLFTVGITIWGLKQTVQNTWSVWAITSIVVGLLLTYFIRDFIFFLLIPAIIAMFLSQVLSINKLLTFGGVYLVILIVGIWLPVFDGQNYLHLIVDKQWQFMALEAGNSNIQVDKLEPTVWGMVKGLKDALANTFFGPFLLKTTVWFHWLAILDNILIGLLLIWGFWRADKQAYTSNTFSIMLRFIGLSYLVLIGYIVPNIGAISRYRSLALLLLLLGMYAHIRSSRAVHN